MNLIGNHVTGLQHIGLPTNDMEKTLAFYTALGFALAHEADNEGERVCFLKLKNICIEAYENGQAVGCSGAIDHIALDVDDIDTVWKLVTAAGYVPRETAPRFLPFWENGVKFFNIQGLNGETVEFSQYLRLSKNDVDYSAIE